MAGSISPDLVEKNGAFVGLFEQPVFPLAGAGESALLVAEQFAFQKINRYGGAIDFDKRGFTPVGQMVDGPGHQLLASPRLSGDKNCGGRITGDLLDLVDHFLEGRAGTDDGDLFKHFQVAPTEVADLPLQGLGLKRQLDDNPQGVCLERLFHVVEGAEFQGFDRAFHRTETGDDNHEEFRIEFLERFEHLDAVFRSEVEIEENEVEVFIGYQFESAPAAGGSEDRITVFAEDAFDIFPNK